MLMATVAFSAVMMSPASATVGSALTACASTDGVNCTNYRGVMATIKVFDPNLQACDGQSVSSIYIRYSPNDVNNFVELGWYQSRTCLSYQTKRIFIKAIAGGTVHNCLYAANGNSLEEFVTANGDYRFMIYQTYPDPTFRFKYWRPDGSERILPCSFSPSLYRDGADAFTSMEIVNQDVNSDEPGPYHFNVWIQKTAGLVPGQRFLPPRSHVLLRLHAYLLDRICFLSAISSQGDHVIVEHN
jgi:hypothetical protein